MYMLPFFSCFLKICIYLRIDDSGSERSHASPPHDQLKRRLVDSSSDEKVIYLFYKQWKLNSPVLNRAARVKCSATKLVLILTMPKVMPIEIEASRNLEFLNHMTVSFLFGI